MLLDLVTVRFLGGYMTKPFYLFGKLAMCILGVSMLVLAVAVAQKFGYLGQPEGLNLNRNVLVALAILLTILAAQCLVIGVVTELLVRIYHESQGRPTYRIRQIHQHQKAAGARRKLPA